MPLYNPVSPHGDRFGPADMGWVSWTCDPTLTNNGSIGAAGVLQMTRLTLDRPATVSALHVIVVTAGATLTNVGFALYSQTGALRTSSVNTNGATAAAFQSSGNKVVTFSTPQYISDHYFYAAWWTTGTTQPTMARTGTGNIYINAGHTLSGGTGLRHAVANTGLTNTAPATATQTGTAPAGWWVAAA